MKVKCFQPLLVKAWNLCAINSTNRHYFSLQGVMNAAIKRTGVSDFGDMDFLEGLKVLLTSLDQYKDYTPFGRFYARQIIVAMLVHRLRNIDLLKRHPEIHKESITKPVIVLGLARSGTTLLFNLLSMDPIHRFIPNWEAFIAQVPPKGNYTFEHDPRRKQAKWMLRLQKYLMPDMDKMHVFAPEYPEECTPILMHSFANQAYACQFNVPDFSSWLDEADLNPAYRHHKKVLQALQWKYPAERWLLKSPAHLPGIDSILKTYPDACLVHIHRDPVNSIPSLASLSQVFRGVFYPYIDTFELGEQVLTRLANDMDRYMESRSIHASEQFHDLSYTEFMKNPLVTVQQIYDQFGFELSVQTEKKMRQFLSENPKNKHGVHSYKSEDFGLTETIIRQRFEKYIDTFKVGPSQV